MNSNFSLLNNSKKTIAYINKQLINYPKEVDAGSALMQS